MVLMSTCCLVGVDSEGKLRDEPARYLTWRFMKTVLFPHTGRIVVQIKREEVKKGHIILTDAQPERICVAIVQETADGSDFCLGDHVIIDSYACQKVTLEGTEYCILKESDILGYTAQVESSDAIG